MFDSDRPGGQGGPDIYSATRQAVSDSWSTPVNLGAPINSPAGESRASLSSDGTTLHFGAPGPGSRELPTSSRPVRRRRDVELSNDECLSQSAGETECLAGALFGGAGALGDGPRTAGVARPRGAPYRLRGHNGHTRCSFGFACVRFDSQNALQIGRFSEQERTGANVRPDLPCRRSRVRVPSSASRNPLEMGGFLVVQVRHRMAGGRSQPWVSLRRRRGVNARRGSSPLRVTSR